MYHGARNGMAPDTATLLAEQPGTLPVFLIILLALSWIGYRYRYKILSVSIGVGGTAIVLSTTFFALFAYTDNPMWEAGAETTLRFAGWLILQVVYILDAVIAGVLMMFIAVASGAWTGVAWFLQSAALPVVTANEFLFLVFTYQLVAGAGSLCALHLWLRTDAWNAVTNAVLGISGTVFFTTGIFAGMVYSQVWNVGEATLLGALMVAPFGYSLGMMAAILVFQPDFSHGTVTLVDWSETRAGSSDAVAGVGDVVRSLQYAVFGRQ